MIRRMRWWRLTREEATELACEHVERQGLPWTDPVSTTRRPLGGWQVMTNSGYRGGNVFIWITRGGKVHGGNQVTPR